ncbi:hypothetical protein XA68_17850 [Ophiocordyceps unilateralis]|uniref:Uncharacterized protein n=1 Tax=Ophiocordyceps unilateralis TaxID=268505 RepID=A0A2A9P470_OPHUN|nr:hypothetical protein XA68_17850 [Ophiocordyceps unilateralis]
MRRACAVFGHLLELEKAELVPAHAARIAMAGPDAAPATESSTPSLAMAAWVRGVEGRLLTLEDGARHCPGARRSPVVVSDDDSDEFASSAEEEVSRKRARGSRRKNLSK